MAFGKTTAQAKIAKLKKRVRVVQGGTSASKTYSIIPMLITYAVSKEDLEISVVSESMPHLRRGAIRDFKKIMIDTGNWHAPYWNATSSTYTFQSGSRIEFFGADQADKLRGARRDILFVNEANNIKFEAWQQLQIRTRLFSYIDFNPSHEFWAHVELEGEDYVDWVTLTYKDNERTPQAVIDELTRAEQKAEKSEYWRNWVNVYVYGKLGTQEGVIFKEHQDWHQIAVLPDAAKFLGYGLDFGYTNDPTAMIAVFQMNNQYIFDEVIYEKRLHNKQIADKIKLNQMHQVLGYADSAEPKSIEEIIGHGVNITGVKKGPDSVRNGLQKMQQITPFLVTSRSLNFVRELRAYSFRKKKYNNRDGDLANDPEPNQQDHGIDAARYFISMHDSGDDFFVI